MWAIFIIVNAALNNVVSWAASVCETFAVLIHASLAKARTEQELQELVSSIAMFVDEHPEMPTLKVYVSPGWAFEGGRAASYELGS